MKKLNLLSSSDTPLPKASATTKQEETRMKFAQLITDARKECGKSQRDLAKVLGISNSSWARWEKGEFIPSNVHTIYMISQVLQLNFFDLIAMLCPEIKEEYQKEFEIINIMKK